MKPLHQLTLLFILVSVKGFAVPDSVKNSSQQLFITLPAPYIEGYKPLQRNPIIRGGLGFGARFYLLPGLMCKKGILPYSQVGADYFNIEGQSTWSIPFQFGADAYVSRVGIHAELGPAYFLECADPAFSNTTVFEYGGGISTGFRLKIFGTYMHYYLQFYVKDIGNHLMLNFVIDAFLLSSNTDQLIIY